MADLIGDDGSGFLGEVGCAVDQVTGESQGTAKEAAVVFGLILLGIEGIDPERVGDAKDGVDGGGFGGWFWVCSGFGLGG